MATEPAGLAENSSLSRTSLLTSGMAPRRNDTRVYCANSADFAAGWREHRRGGTDWAAILDCDPGCHSGKHIATDAQIPRLSCGSPL